jgi:hypothetical protein
MNRKTLKIVMLFFSLIVSTVCILLFIYGKIKNDSFTDYDSELFEIHIYLHYFNAFFCIIGIILFIRYLIYTNDKAFSSEYFLLVPSVIMSILIVILELSWPGRLPLIKTIGSSLFLFFYINQKYNIIIKIVLCLIFPINIFINWLLMWLLMMY